MITIKHDAGNLLEITVDGILKAEDFKDLAEKADALIKEHSTVRVMIDATGFDGWDNLEAAEKHFGFVKTHHEKVERLAVIAGHMWQHWLGALAQVFVHPKVKVFDKDQVEQAKHWVKE